ncbi:RNA polymerase sigma-70 factor (ECF subfamily) [Rhizomicrobium palustre]|uniref:RNA polymerase sigma-70 factor (ECF subfamily) n=1 Tax=Rhizomicrobium palustre TaxID=189966 RepID=A0A846N069_9PROT|nr:RNA polymerase sigma factor [Rhizomicrobium palustre]NIK88953.1 RNA polymerase sigma-70 factor (ECF subfamily) [Rhizomicrobium palustre]
MKNLLVTQYQDFVRWLTRRLGSSDLAQDALQETFLRLEQGSSIGPVHNPKAYLLRIALNMASNRRAADNRRLATSEVDKLLDLPDDAPDPARAVEAKSEISALKRALAELPARRREIFLASWIENLPHPEIARRYQISIRTVQIELKLALEYCDSRLNRRNKLRG